MQSNSTINLIYLFISLTSIFFKWFFFQIINIKLYSKYQLVFFLSQKVKYLDSACSAGYTDSSGTCDGNFLKNI